MTVNDLIALLQTLPEPDRKTEIKVWLPGSTIRLSGKSLIMTHQGCWAVEGNVDPGSALDDLAFR